MVKFGELADGVDHSPSPRFWGTQCFWESQGCVSEHWPLGRANGVKQLPALRGYQAPDFHKQSRPEANQVESWVPCPLFWQVLRGGQHGRPVREVVLLQGPWHSVGPHHPGVSPQPSPWPLLSEDPALAGGGADPPTLEPACLGCGGNVCPSPGGRARAGREGRVDLHRVV